MGGSLPEDVDEITSAIPFLALALGKQSFKKLYDEIKINNLFIALFMTFLLHKRRVKRLSNMKFI